jgi:CxxC motif-containing protein
MLEKANYIEELKEKPELLKTLPKEYLTDKEIVRAALVRKWHDYETNFEVLEFFKLADATLRYNKDFVKELIVSCSGYLFEFLPLALREDEEILLFALKHSGYDYIYNKMKNDALSDDEDYNEDHVDDISYSLYLHICYEKSIMSHAGKTILNNKKVILKTIELEEKGFFFVSDALHDDKELALAAVLIDATNFESLSERLRDDEDLAMAAAEGNGEYLAEFDYHVKWSYLDSCFFGLLSNRLKNDRNFIVNLITNLYGAEFVLKYVSEQFKNDKELVLIAVKERGRVLEYASDELKNDKEIVIEALKNDSSAFRFVSKELQIDKKFIVIVLKTVPHILQFVSEEFKDDKDLVLEILKINANVLKFVSARLKNDIEVLEACENIIDKIYLKDLISQIVK